MNNTICTILIVLLTLIANTQSSASSDRLAFKHKKILLPNALFDTSTNAQPFQILSARDDQTVDCLRSGNCRK